jgi:hypothetical protein
VPETTIFSGCTGGGIWRVTRMTTLTGDNLPEVESIDISNGRTPSDPAVVLWRLRGIGSNMRYATRREMGALAEVQPPLNRPESICAALIPIRKSAAWWALAQDERTGIFVDDSAHNAIGLRHLPAIARRLLHCRDLSEPFDFLTWFEFAPEAEPSFNQLVAELRATREWSYVEREVDIRLRRIAS